MKKNENTITDNPKISRKITRYQNIDENEIVITESKLENILIKHKEIVSAGSDWKTPLGLIITIIMFFLTGNVNKSFLNIESSAWKLLFLITFLISIIWLIKSFWINWKNKKIDINCLISLIKNETKDRK